MNSERYHLIEKFKQELPRAHFLGTDKQYQERMEQYADLRGNTDVFLIDEVIMGGLEKVSA